MTIKKYILFIILFPFVGCKAQDHSKLKVIFSTSCYLESNLALDKGSLTIYQNILDRDGSLVNQVYYTKYQWNEDFMQKKINKDLYMPQKLDSLNSMAKSNFFIKDLNKYVFKYDNIPEELRRHVSNFENIQKYKFMSNCSVYLTKDSNYKKIFYQVSRKKTIVVNLRVDYLDSDFFLYDIAGDESPEVFVFTRNYIMGHNIFDIVIYKIED